MNNTEMKERVARSLRAMKKEPKALLFINGNTGWTYNAPEICGVPVLHCVDLRCFHNSCPFVPLGATDSEIDFRDRKRFAEAWYD